MASAGVASDSSCWCLEIKPSNVRKLSLVRSASGCQGVGNSAVLIACLPSNESRIRPNREKVG